MNIFAKSACGALSLLTLALAASGCLSEDADQDTGEQTDDAAQALQFMLPFAATPPCPPIYPSSYPGCFGLSNCGPSGYYGGQPSWPGSYNGYSPWPGSYSGYSPWPGSFGGYSPWPSYGQPTTYNGTTQYFGLGGWRGCSR